MQMFPPNAAVREIWKTFPVRFEGPRASRCCGCPTVLVQSMEGGFVSSNCSKCGKYETLSHHEFIDGLRIWVTCPQCRNPMRREIINKNYGFVCDTCEAGIRLADILPRWHDLELGIKQNSTSS